MPIEFQQMANLTNVSAMHRPKAMVRRPIPQLTSALVSTIAKVLLARDANLSVGYSMAFGSQLPNIPGLITVVNYCQHNTKSKSRIKKDTG